MSAVALVLIQVLLVASVVVPSVAPAAAAQDVPAFNVDPSCRAAARDGGQSDVLDICRATELKAREQIVKMWSDISAADKAQCVPLSKLGGTPTYTELLTCIELTREARRLRSQHGVAAGQSEPSTTGQGGGR